MSPLTSSMADSSAAVHIGLVSAEIILSMVAILVAWILILRVRRDKEDARRKTLLATWRPILAESMIEDPEVVPPIAPRDLHLVLYLWNHMQESIKGDVAQGLNSVARRAGMDQEARRLLQHGRLREQLLAVATLGHLRDAQDWDALAGLAASENPFLSLAAARGLVMIDPARALTALIPLISHRSDWSPLKVITMLTAAGSDVAAKAVGEAAVEAAPAIAARLIRYLAATRSPQALPPLRKILARPDCPDEVIAACLHVFGLCSDPRDLPTVRRFIGHGTWFVRLQATVSLGAMGMEEDEPALHRLLHDEKWWVRYRAAEALTALPSMTVEKLAAVHESLTDPAVREVLTPFLHRMQHAASSAAAA